MINRVTITGADNSIEPDDLLRLSAKYKFVEWGILLSRSRTGTERFPSVEWLNYLAESNSMFQMNLSAHVCGGWVRELVNGQNPCGTGLPTNFLRECARMQLNFHAEKRDFSDDFIQLVKIMQPDVILQMDGVNDAILTKFIEHNQNSFQQVNALFDLSHGEGVLPDSWPKPIPHVCCGYAGGLGPDNLDEQMDKISNITGHIPVWVDMETKVRSNNDRQFDLEKVERCLEIASKYIRSEYE